MKFIRVSWLDGLWWTETIQLLQNPALVEAQPKQVERHDDTIQRRLRLEQFRKRQAEAKITRIQEDQLNETSLFTRQEAVSKIEELRKVIEKAELVAKLGIKIYPSEDLTHIRIFCGLNVTEPQKVSRYKTSMASPKL